MWNSLRVSIYTTPEYRPQEFAGEEFYFATIEEFEIAIDRLAWELYNIYMDNLYIRIKNSLLTLPHGGLLQNLREYFL
jgi:guanylate kinase